MHRHAISLLAALFVAAPAAAGDSWITYGNPGSGIEIGTPSTWRDVRQPAELLRTTRSLAHRYPRLAGYPRSLTKGIRGPLLKIRAIDVLDAALAKGCVTDVTMTQGDFAPERGWPPVMLHRVESAWGASSVASSSLRAVARSSFATTGAGARAGLRRADGRSRGRSLSTHS